MPFIGKQPEVGAYSKLDAITTSATATYNLTLDSGAYYPSSANHLLVSLNGVMQAPQDSFTVSGSTIVFASTLASTDSIDFIMALGDVLDIGTPSDGTVTSAKLAGPLTTPSTLDVNGAEFILDADADSSITADTDDQIDIKVGGSDKVHINQYGIGSGAVPIASDGAVIQATGNDGISFRRSGQTNAGIIRPLAGSADGMRFTVGGSGDRIVLDETNDILYTYGLDKEHKKTTSSIEREVKGLFEISASTSNATVFTVDTGSQHSGYYYEVICYGSDWSGHSSARVIKRGFINGYNGYNGHDVVESDGPYAGNIIENIVWNGTTGQTTYQLRLDTGTTSLKGYVRLVGSISTYSIN